MGAGHNSAASRPIPVPPGSVEAHTDESPASSQSTFDRVAAAFRPTGSRRESVREADETQIVVDGQQGL